MSIDELIAQVKQARVDLERLDDGLSEYRRPSDVSTAFGTLRQREDSNE